MSRPADSVTVHLDRTLQSSDQPSFCGQPDYGAMVKRRLPGHTVSTGDRLEWIVGGRTVSITIGSIQGQESPAYVDREVTQVHFQYIETAQSSEIDPNATISDETTALIDMISSSYDNASAFRTLGMPVAKSVLVHGVQGVGKTTMIKTVARHINHAIFELSVHDLMDLKEEFEHGHFKNYNPLHLLISKAITTTPALLVIRDLDILKPGDAKTERILQLLSNEIARVHDDTRVYIIGFACEMRRLPDALQKTSIFRQHLHLPIPTLPQRQAILKTLLRSMNLDPAAGGQENPVDYIASQISLRTSGYVARDLALLCRRAVLHALRDKPDDMVDQIARLHIDPAEPMETDAPAGSPLVRWKDFEYALAHSRPSQQVQVESTLPKRSWDDLGGYHKIKDRIRKATLLPLSEPTLFSRLGIKPPSGVLLYGPSGCGKTALVQALASESMMNVMSINGPEIFSKYLGDTELKIRRLFATAKRIAPCILFIDELDAIGSKRGWSHGESSGGVNERVMSTLLNEMDGVEGRQGVIVIGCTSCPDQIDDAILRPGRMDQVLYVGLPDLEDRREIIQVIRQRMTTDAGLDVDALARQTEFCTGADIDQIFRAAGTVALRENIEADSIKEGHIQAVLADIAAKARQRVLEEDSLLVYEQFQNAHAPK